MKDVEVFKIELNNPNYVLPKGKGFNLSSIFSVCFEYPNNDLTLIWRDITIPFSYDHMVAQIITDVLEMLKDISANESGNHLLNFGMNSLQTTWEIKWNQNDMEIQSFWKVAPKNLTSLLNNKSSLKTETKIFLEQWEKLISFVASIISRSGIEINDWYYNMDFFLKVQKSLTERLKHISE